MKIARQIFIDANVSTVNEFYNCLDSLLSYCIEA